MYPQNRQRKSYSNSYRHGVLIANYVEDIYGKDLQNNFANEKPKFKPTTEAMDQYSWPQLSSKHIKPATNDMTLKCNSNFDLNLNFTKKNAEDYFSLVSNVREYDLQDKNKFLPEQNKVDNMTSRLMASKTGSQIIDNINNETQTRLKNLHETDSNSLLYTKRSGLVKNLLFGHGLEQNNFNKNEYASTYQ